MFCLFPEFLVQKNDPKIKVLRMAWKFNMIFLEYFWIFSTNNIRGGAPGGHTPPGRASIPRRALEGCGPHVGPSLISLAHVITYLQKKTTIALSFMFLLSNLWISISLLEAPFPKLFWGIATWYVAPSLLQLVFALVLYILNN